MPVDLSYRPLFEQLHPLTVQFEQEGKPPVSQPAAFEGCAGYDGSFLNEFVVPWPRAVGNAAADVLTIEGVDEARLDYMHFSVTMSASRRMAMYVGVNIEGARSESIPRTKDRWVYDGRIPLSQQIGNELYASNLLDRGHLVRREDPNWGEDAQRANEQTFHFTNCSPQMAGFNQVTWLSLENYILLNARSWKERASVFSGPVFAPTDREYRGVKIPEAFWKVVAFLSDEGLPSATAYIIGQSKELTKLEAAYGRFKTYQCSIQQIEALTSLDFGDLRNFDGFSNSEAAGQPTIVREVNGPADILV